MSQWGIEKNIKGMRFVPLVKTKPFEPASHDHTIENIILLDHGTNQKHAEEFLERLKGEFIGQPYKTWEEIL